MSGPALNPALQSGRPTVVEFGANACVSCREMKVVLGRLRQAHGDRFAVVEVDLLKERELAERHHQLEDRLHELTDRHYLSSSEQFEEVTIKKRKLAVKDQMEQIAREYAQGRRADS